MPIAASYIDECCYFIGAARAGQRSIMYAAVLIPLLLSLGSGEHNVGLKCDIPNHTSGKIKLILPAYSHTAVLLVSSLNFALVTLGRLWQG